MNQDSEKNHRNKNVEKLNDFTKLYAISRLTNIYPQYNGIFQTKKNFEEPFQDLSTLLQQVCSRQQQAKRTSKGGQRMITFGVSSSFQKPSQILQNNYLSIPRSRIEVEKEIIQNIAEENIEYVLPNLKSQTKIKGHSVSINRLNLGNYFASGKNKIQTDCCNFGETINRPFKINQIQRK